MRSHRAVVPDDRYDLDRFVRAQETDYNQALSELRSGRKRTHWMWYIFLQLEGTRKQLEFRSLFNQRYR